MGSDSDLPVMQGAIDVLAEFGVAARGARSSPRTAPPTSMYEYARTAAERGPPGDHRRRRRRGPPARA